MPKGPLFSLLCELYPFVPSIFSLWVISSKPPVFPGICNHWLMSFPVNLSQSHREPAEMGIVRLLLQGFSFSKSDWDLRHCVSISLQVIGNHECGTFLKSWSYKGLTAIREQALSFMITIATLYGKNLRWHSQINNFALSLFWCNTHLWASYLNYYLKNF